MSSLLPQHVQDVSLNINLQEEVKPSMKLSAKLAKWVKYALSDANSRNLFGFLLINLSFAFVELFYGMWTNSLGLISDSFHMFFDCSALLAGLVATIVSKWPPNEKFSYGYVRAEVVAAFVNALFLLFIAFFIFAEAIERAFEPPEVKHDRLLVISIGGFIVNLAGIFVFHHGGHGHSHGHSHDHSHDHSHGHSHHSHDQFHGHSYGHSHDHSHDHSHHDHSHDHSHHSHAGHGHHHHDHTGGSPSQIMHSIFLHILADTLGSVGVIISSLLIHQFGWMLADPICSMFIAILITISVYPLLTNSLGVLMQRTPLELDHVLPHHIQKIIEMESVAQVLNCHIWTLCTGVYIANLRIEIFPGSDTYRLHTVIKNILTQAGIQQSYIELTLVD